MGSSIRRKNVQAGGGFQGILDDKRRKHKSTCTYFNRFRAALYVKDATPKKKTKSGGMTASMSAEARPK